MEALLIVILIVLNDCCSLDGDFLFLIGILCSLFIHLVLVCNLLEISLLHHVLIMQDSMRELLLEDFLVEELPDSSRYYGLFENLCDRQSLADINHQKL